MDLVRRAGRKPLPPDADLGGPQLVYPRRPERVDGMLKPIAESLDRDVLGDVLLEVLRDECLQARRLRAVAVTSWKPSESLGERRAGIALRPESALLWSPTIREPIPIGPAPSQLVHLSVLHLALTPSGLVKLTLQRRTDAASLQEALPVRPEEAHRAALPAEAVAGNIASLEAVKHPVGGEPQPFGYLARGEKTDFGCASATDDS